MGVPRQAVAISSTQLKIAASEMAEMAARLDAVATKMQDNDIANIDVTHRKSFNVGMKYCANFCNAADAGWIDAALHI